MCEAPWTVFILLEEFRGRAPLFLKARTMTKYRLYLLLTLSLLTSACGSSSEDNSLGTAADLTPPSAPTTLTNAAAPSTMVDLNWNASTDNVGVTEYWIYRCRGTNCSPTRYQSGITETTFSETGLAFDTLYRYAVSALDAAGNQSPLSAIYELTTPPLRDIERPTPPSNVTAAPVSSTQIDLRWTAAIDDSGVIASYSVYRCQGTCSPRDVVTTGVKTTTMKDKTVVPSTTYTYAVTAFDAAGNESLLSSAVSATTHDPPDTIPPTAPSGLNVTPISATQINLSWQASTDNIEVQDYIVQRCTGVGCTNLVQIDTVPSGTLAYRSIGLTPSTTYTYSVRARDQAGNISPPSTPISATTPAAPDASAPTVPTGLSATARSSSRISLSWTASSDNVGVTKYSIYRCTGSGCTPTTKLVDVTAPTTSFSNSGLTASTTYTYAVTASDAVNNESGKSSRAFATTQAPPVTQTYTFIGAGDIATSINNAAESTAKLLDAAVADDPDTIVFTAGDNVHPNGSASEYSIYYDPTWGRHKVRTRPSPGNHDYYTPGASGYLNYFCPNSTTCSFPGGTRQRYYSYDLGNWHLISLDSEEINSSQLFWLQQDLATHADSCILAYWHRPRFTSGNGAGSQPDVQPFWDALYAAKVDVVVNGHEHSYERFAKMSASGSADPTGIREFVVGTGGIPNFGFGSPQPNSEVRLQNIQGVIKFDLRNNGYDWTFIPSTNTQARDSGSDVCNK